MSNEELGFPEIFLHQLLFKIRINSENLSRISKHLTEILIFQVNVQRFSGEYTGILWEIILSLVEHLT